MPLSKRPVVENPEDGAPEGPRPGWVGMAEVREMVRDGQRREAEWRAQATERCGRAVQVEGHLLACGREPGHTGQCRVADDIDDVRKVIRQHLAHPGQCRRRGCTQ